LTHEANERFSVFARRREKTRAGDGRERHAHQHLGVILDTDPVGRLRPFTNKNKLSHAVQLEIQGTDSENFAVLLNYQMVREPAGLFVDTAGLLETVQPVPFHEGRARAQQTIPCLPWDRGNLAHDLYCQFIAHRSDPITTPCLIKLPETKINPPGIARSPRAIIVWPVARRALLP